MSARIFIPLILIFTLTGCTPDFIDNNSYNFTSTLGQELIDLKKALDEGAIDEEQYDELYEGLKESRFGH
ncbi:MAG: hypothetical protein GY744_19885 [Gammaproteobacteria bacterium]|nr:hypothetical protein [Gammaproteobacteria bacterium]